MTPMPCSMIDPHWTQVLSALLVPLVAVLGSAIAYQSWRTSQNKLKLDLFEKRLAVYDGAAQFLATIMTSGKANNEEMWQFAVKTRGAKWLLSDDIANYLDRELRNKAIELHALQTELNGPVVSEERSKNLHRERDIKLWFGNQFGELDAKFAPFLKLRH